MFKYYMIDNKILNDEEIEKKLDIYIYIMKKNFIDLGDDPTLPISSEISLEEKYNNLSEHEKLLLAAKVGLKMNHLPADIDRFLEDPYFLGDPRITNEGKSIFKIWRKAFREIFPSPIITKYPYISLSG